MASASDEALGGGQRPDEDVFHANIVIDPENDIATSELLDKIIVGVQGRQRLQKIFIRKSGGGGKTTTQYNPEVDAPAADRTVSILPTKEEIESRAETLEFLVVGLVFAVDTQRYSTKASGASRSKKRDAERTARGVLPAQSNILRVVVPTTEFISTASIKYYVACHQVHGLCNLRVISADAIFYFNEIWDGISETSPVKERRRQLGANCRKLAARDKEQPQRAITQITAEGVSKTSNVLSITPAVNAGNVIWMQYSIYAISKEKSTVLALKNTLESILPDLLNRPNDDGILGFYDFDNILEEEDARKAIASITAIYPTMPRLNPKLVLELHAALRRTGLGGKLPYQSLVAFLHWGHDRAAAGWDSERLDTIVKTIIHDIEISNQIQAITTNRTVSKLENGTIDVTLLLSGIRVALDEIVQYFKAHAKALREQHGGVAKHASIEDLMIKIGNCVDKTALKSLEEQVFAIHAEQLATANNNGVGYLEKCIGLIDQALAITT